MEEREVNLQEFKIVLLGESGVGKTSIIQRYTKDKFENEKLPTKCASFETKVVKIDESEEKYIKLNIWDTAGQEKYRALTKIFYKEASAAILVYDITNKKSFEEVKDYWYNQVKECSQEDTIK